ncbi:NAD-dependent epimerase/dehydratase family protein [Vibrio rumoiensis]|uniref:NAD-dependent epimerase/dehydratase domain-containing protein n=1 Tax=Vibrio rumoiensis 1S-45 TaxID=1188252 RepID=A0A1E5E3E7_9VIBR|nr:NAD-dependent epimerase/dehydratase family protein [Vibrio rumoiensis]OEF26820.1 hypothetical protein A1QC_15225 [Vibrio rumoiensis 1S-45]
MKQKQISICGCGWLGLPLAKSFVESDFSVFGSKRSLVDAQALSNDGIYGISLSLPINIDTLSQSDIQATSAFFQFDVLIINVPPGRQPNSADLFKQNIQNLSYLAKQFGGKKIIFISTTSVYAGCDGEITEQTLPIPNTESGHAHVWAENWLREQWQDDLVVLRLSGLIGADRHPVKHIVKRFESTMQPLDHGLTPVNLIHQNDVISAIHSVVQNWPSQKVFHLAATTHPTRAEYYQEMAKRVDLLPPEFVLNGEQNKSINAKQSIKALNIELTHSDLMQSGPYQ